MLIFVAYSIGGLVFRLWARFRDPLDRNGPPKWLPKRYNEQTTKEARRTY
jgi:hypothetical protein